MKLTWHGHACFMLESKDGSLVFDPYSPGSVPGLELGSLEADMVICSHKHGDHFYHQGVTLSKTTPTFATHRIPTYHDDSLGQKRGNNFITVVETEGLRLAHVGDLGHIPSASQLEKLGKVDILLVPVGGFYTINAQQAAELVEMLSSAVTIPMHYRSEKYGLTNVSTLDAFLALAENVQYSDSNVLELDAVSEVPVTIVLKCPVEM